MSDDEQSASFDGDLTDLRRRADAAVTRFVELLDAGEVLSPGPRPAEDVWATHRAITDFDIDALHSDARVLGAALQMVGTEVSRIVEAQVAVAAGWHNSSTPVAGAMITSHRDRAESVVEVLRRWSDATDAAATGIATLTRTWLTTVIAVGDELLCGVTLDQIRTSTIPDDVPQGFVLAEIESRRTLFQTAAQTSIDGIDEMLGVLDRVTERLDGTGHTDGADRAFPSDDAEGVLALAGDR